MVSHSQRKPMADLRRQNQGSSGDDSEDDVLSTVNITVTCVADPSKPSGLKCRIIHNPTDTGDDELSESLARVRKDEDGEEDEEVDVEDTKKKPSKTKPKKPSKHDDDDDDAKDHDSSDDDDEDEDDDEDCDDDDDESEILECVQKSVMKRR
jgi:hypothetical protein